MVDGWLARKPDARFDLLATADPPYQDLQAPGAYVLLRTDGGSFEYPHGRFRAFYVGESGASGRRVHGHRRHALKARGEITADGRIKSYWYARYGLAAKFGAEVLWFRVAPGESSKHLETAIADEFYWAAGSLPIANGRWPNQWPRPKVP